MASKKKKKRSKAEKTEKKEIKLKDRFQMTESEYLRIVEKGRRILRAYLIGLANEDMSERGKECLFRVIEDEYRYRMDTDLRYFESVNRFLFDRQTNEDPIKDSVFMYGLMQETEREGRIKETLAARFPDVYRLPEEENKSFSRFFGLKTGR